MVMMFEEVSLANALAGGRLARGLTTEEVEEGGATGASQWGVVGNVWCHLGRIIWGGG